MELVEAQPESAAPAVTVASRPVREDVGPSTVAVSSTTPAAFDAFYARIHEQLQLANQLNSVLMTQLETSSRLNSGLQTELAAAKEARGKAEEEARVLRERNTVLEASINSEQEEKITTIHLPTIVGRPVPELMRFTTGNPRDEACSAGQDVRCLDTMCTHTGFIRRIDLRKPLPVDPELISKYRT